MTNHPAVTWPRVAVGGIILSVSVIVVEVLVRLAVPLSGPLQDATALPGARFAVMRGLVQEDDNGYGLVPGFVGRDSAGNTWAINSHGMRDREYDLQGADANRRFVFAAGDSFSFGAGVQTDQSFLSAVERSLQTTDPRWAVVKAGVPGFSLVQTVATVRRHLARFSPELVIIQVIPETEVRAINPQRVIGGLIVIPRKGWHYYTVGDELFDSPVPPGLVTSIDAGAQRASYGYRILRRAAVKFLAGDVDWTPEELARGRELGLGALADLHEELQHRWTPLLVVLTNWAQPSAEGWDSTRALNDVYVQFCNQQGIAVLDTQPAFKAETARVGYLGRTAVDSHWNAAGHRLAAEIVTRFISERGLVGPQRKGAANETK